MESIESLLYLIVKKKSILTRSTLNIHTRELTSNDAKTNQLVVKFNLNKWNKFTRHADGSWELSLDTGKTYRYANEDASESFKWISRINRILSNQNDDNSTQFDQDESFSNNSSDLSNEIYNVQIDSNLTDPQFFTALTLKTNYFFTIDESGYSLQNKDTGEMHAFDSNTIRKFGATKHCFAFELGRKSEYGPGRIALVSTRNQDVKLIYDHFYDLSNRKFMQMSNKLNELEKLKVKLSTETINNNKIPPQVQSESSETGEINSQSTKRPIVTVSRPPPPQEPTYVTIQNSPQLKPRPFNLVSNENHQNVEIGFADKANHLIKTMENEHKTYDAYEIKIQVEDRNPSIVSEQIIRNNNIALYLTNKANSISKSSSTLSVTETDEEFYKEKYRPQYISNKSLKSPDTEFFRDNANDAIYSKVKRIQQ